ncbi:MAG: branched-chain amino acid transport system permease protein [Solirubrobacteraceae bacterium]|jgi:branched-chain amino acid transport system permease protein|nr:branched-chain amino acid transport system permease protein [Solirubrobacteraceae bacterium]
MGFFTQLVTDPGGFYRGHELLVAQCGINAMLAVSIWFTLYSGQLALATAGFMAIGGYTSVVLAIHGHVPLPVGTLAGCVLAALAGVAIGLPVLRLRGVFLAIATIAFGEALRFGLILNLPLTGRGQGLTNLDADPTGGILPVWISVSVLGYLGWSITRTRLGHAWAAIREDELAAAAAAIHVRAHKLAAFVIGAVIAAYAGALDAHLNFFVDPTEYGFDRAVQVLVFAVLGGIGSVAGPIVGAVGLTALPEAARWASDYREVLYGVILMLVVVFRPQGLVARRRGTRPRGRAGRRPRPRSRGGPAAARTD